uniref:Uncharacterized protein n=1 Tax=Micrurus spixii TaxID=129469 RepID=A0A2D4N1L9_9SAUR
MVLDKKGSTPPLDTSSLGDVNLLTLHTYFTRLLSEKYRATYSIHWIKNKTNHCCPYQMTPPGISVEDDDHFALKTGLKFPKRGWNISPSLLILICSLCWQFFSSVSSVSSS